VRRKAIAIRRAASGDGIKVLALGLDAAEEAPRARDAARFAAMAQALRAKGYAFSLRCLAPAADLGALCAVALEEERPSIVFPSFYDRSLYGALASSGLPFVGSSAHSLELLGSRSSLKKLWAATGIASPSYFPVRRTRAGSIVGRRLVALARDFPYIVKPDGDGEHRGKDALSVAFDSRALALSVDAGLEEHDGLVVEHFLGGSGAREYSVAMLGNGKGALILPAEVRLKDERPIRAVTREDRLQGLAKAVSVESGTRELLADLASRALAAASARDYARCDLIESEGRLYALAAKGLPPMPDPWFEGCAAGAGLGPSEYVTAIFEAALSRSTPSLK
jgi:D-alanine-D-alanine ligase-like ATP-grasp enzyme